jgi:glycosyltransferase involved in cell wall biosynthesis
MVPVSTAKYSEYPFMADVNEMEKTATTRPIRVFLMDLLSMVPYYTGHLCSSLARVQGIEVVLGSITYSHDRSFFKRAGLLNDPGFLDVAYSLPNAISPVRSALKVIECLLNLAIWSLRFLVQKPDIVHVQFIPLVNYKLPFELWFLKLARAFGIRLIYTVHNILPQLTGERHKAAYAEIYSLVDGFICHDVCAKARLVSEFNISPNRISIIPHGPLFEPKGSTPAARVRAKVDLPEDTCIVLWQGIVRPYKGISFLLAGWKMAREAGLKGVLVIVGTGEPNLLRALEGEIAAAGIESSVRLVFRFVSADELANFYQAADILVYPYSEITTSGALMTGVGFGKAIVASALPAFQQLLHHEDNALLVPYGDVNSLADALGRLAGDLQLRSRLASRLLETQARAPQWTDISRQTAHCYQAVLSSAPAHCASAFRR